MRLGCWLIDGFPLAVVCAALGLVGCGADGSAGHGNEATGGSRASKDAGSSGGASGSGGWNATGGAGTSGIVIQAGDAGDAKRSRHANASYGLGEGDGQDVITIGDSYMNLLITGIQQSLRNVSGRSYRTYGVPGALMLDEAIPNQYAAALATDPDIKTVVMSGGGNDVLASECTGACTDLVDRVFERQSALKKKMGEDGVLDVIIVSYGYPTDPTHDAALDYYRGLLASQCLKDGPAPRCHYIDPVEELKGKIDSDGIHPTPEGFDILGKMVWDLMQAEGVRR